MIIVSGMKCPSGGNSPTFCGRYQTILMVMRLRAYLVYLIYGDQNFSAQQKAGSTTWPEPHGLGQPRLRGSCGFPAPGTDRAAGALYTQGSS